MSTRHEKTLLGLVPGAIALAVSLVITGLVAAGFVSATSHIPAGTGPIAAIISATGADPKALN